MIRLSQASHQVDSGVASRLSQSFEALLNRKDLGFFQLPEREQLWAQTSHCADWLLADFQHFVFVGIGGSGLGGRTVRDAFHANQSIHFLENVDRYSVDRVLSSIDCNKTAFVLTSKSGGTLETLAIANAIEARLGAQGLSLKGRSVVITEPKQSALANWAKSFKATQLEIPFDVGGRFSVLTPVGLLPAALSGLNLTEMREGAIWARQNQQVVVELSSLIQQSFLRNEWITQFWIYSDRLATFGAWLQQLWAESLAKSQTRQGAKAPRVSTPMACVGAVDQHSILQQVAEGERDKLILFFDIVGEKDQVVPNLFPELKHLDGNGLQSVLEAESQATLQALSQAGVSNLRLELDGLTAASLAACFMLFELVIGTLGEGFDINAFDQPGVENGKVLAKQLLMK